MYVEQSGSEAKAQGAGPQRKRWNGISLTPNRPAMPFGNRKKYFKGSFQFSIVTISKISPLWKP